MIAWLFFNDVYNIGVGLHKHTEYHRNEDTGTYLDDIIYINI